MSIETDSSSSLDQDIFNCLFDDHSDDDNETKEEETVKQASITKCISPGDIYMSINKCTDVSGEALHATASTVNTSKLTKVTTKSTSISNINIRNTTKSIAQKMKQEEKTVVAPSSNYQVNSNLSSRASECHMNVQPLMTIIKPEKYVGEDLIIDPLNLDDDSLSDVVSDLLSLSDISGHTVNNLSDFDDDDDNDYDLENIYEIPSSTALLMSTEVPQSYETINTNKEMLTKRGKNLQLLNMLNETYNNSDELKKLNNYQHHRSQTSYDFNMNNANSTSDSKNIGPNGTISAARAISTTATMESLPAKSFVRRDTILTPYSVQMPSTKSHIDTATIINPITTMTNTLLNADTTCTTLQTKATETPIRTCNVNNFSHIPDRSKPIKLITPMGISLPSSSIQLDGRNITSPNALTNDSYLPVVGEMLDEACAVEMLKKEQKQKEKSYVQDVGAEIKVGCIDNFINTNGHQNKLILVEQFQQSVDLANNCGPSTLLLKEPQKQQQEQVSEPPSLNNILDKTESKGTVVELVPQYNEKRSIFEEQQLMDVDKVKVQKQFHLKTSGDNKSEKVRQNENMQKQYQKQSKQQLCETVFEGRNTTKSKKIKGNNPIQSSMMQSAVEIKLVTLNTTTSVNEIIPKVHTENTGIIHQITNPRNSIGLNLTTTSAVSSSEKQINLKAKNITITKSIEDKVNIAAYQCHKETVEELYTKSNNNKINIEENGERLNNKTTEKIVKEISKELITNNGTIDNTEEFSKNVNSLGTKCVTWPTQSNTQNTLHSSNNNKRAETSNEQNTVTLNTGRKISESSKIGITEVPLTSEVFKNITNPNACDKSESVPENANMNMEEILYAETISTKLNDGKGIGLSQEITEIIIDDNLNEENFNNFTQGLAIVPVIETSTSLQSFHNAEKEECVPNLEIFEYSDDTLDDDLNYFKGFEETIVNSVPNNGSLANVSDVTSKTTVLSKSDFVEMKTKKGIINECQHEANPYSSKPISVNVDKTNAPKTIILRIKKETDEKKEKIINKLIASENRQIILSTDNAEESSTKPAKTEINLNSSSMDEVQNENFPDVLSNDLKEDSANAKSSTFLMNKEERNGRDSEKNTETKLESKNMEYSLSENFSCDVLPSKKITSTANTKPESTKQENIITEKPLLKDKDLPYVKTDKDVSTQRKESSMGCRIKPAEEKQKSMVENLVESLKQNELSNSKDEDYIFKHDKPKNLKNIFKQLLCVEEEIKENSVEKKEEKQGCISNSFRISTDESKQFETEQDPSELVNCKVEEISVNENTKLLKKTPTESSLLSSREISTLSQSDNYKCTTTTNRSSVGRVLQKLDEELSISENESNTKICKEQSSSNKVIEQDGNTGLSGVCDIGLNADTSEQSSKIEHSTIQMSIINNSELRESSQTVKKSASTMSKVVNTVPLTSEEVISQSSGEGAVDILEVAQFKKNATLIEQTKERLYKKTEESDQTMGDTLNINLKDGCSDDSITKKNFSKVSEYLEEKTKSTAVSTESKIKISNKKHNSKSIEATKGKYTINANEISFYEWKQMLRSKDQKTASTNACEKSIGESRENKSERKSESKGTALKSSCISQKIQVEKHTIEIISNNVKTEKTQKKVEPNRNSHSKLTKNDKNCDKPTVYSKVKSIPSEYISEAPKLKNKRSEIEMLMASWSKNMKESGIELLINESKLEKRRRRSKSRNRQLINETVTMEKDLHKDDEMEIFNSNQVKDDTDDINNGTNSSANNIADGTSNNTESTTMKKKENSDIVHVEKMKKSLCNLNTLEVSSSNTLNAMPFQSETTAAQIDKTSQRLNKHKRKSIKALPNRRSKGNRKHKYLLHHSNAPSVKMRNQSKTIICKSTISIAPEVKCNVKKNLSCQEFTIPLNRSFVSKYLKDNYHKEEPFTSQRDHKLASVTTSVNSVMANVRTLKKIRSKHQETVQNKPIHRRSLSSTSKTNKELLLAQHDIQTMKISQPKNKSNVNQDESSLPDTSSLTTPPQNIAAAAAIAMNLKLTNNSNSSSCQKTPSDTCLHITSPNYNRLLDSTYHAPSFGVTPLLIDGKNTRTYSFLYPANHGNVALDHCCLNLDGPMPVVNPTCIHGQTHVPVRDLPASIVLDTTIVTPAELENDSPNISSKSSTTDKDTSNSVKNSPDSSRQPPNILSYIQLRRLDNVLKKFARPYDEITFFDRQRIMESLLATSKFQAKDIEEMILFLEEYNKQINLLKSPKSNTSTSSESISTIETRKDEQKTPTSSDKLGNVKNSVKNVENLFPKIKYSALQKYQIPIFDTDGNFIAYQINTANCPSTVQERIDNTIYIVPESHGNAVLSKVFVTAGSVTLLKDNVVEENNNIHQSYKDSKNESNTNISSIDKTICRTRAGRVVKRPAIKLLNALLDTKTTKTSKPTTKTVKSINNALKSPYSTLVSTSKNTSEPLGIITSKITKSKRRATVMAASTPINLPDFSTSGVVCVKNLSVNNSGALEQSAELSTIPFTNRGGTQAATIKTMSTTQRLTRKRAAASSKCVIASKTKPSSVESLKSNHNR